MQTVRNKKKMTIKLNIKEAQKKGLDNCENIILEKLRAFASEKGWENYNINYDAEAKDGCKYFVYTVIEDHV